MSSLQTFILSVGSVFVLSALFGTLFPQGNIKKAGETAMSFLIVLLLFAPVRALGKQEIDFPQISQAETTVSVEETYAASFEEVIRRALDSQGFSIAYVKAAVVSDANGYLTLQSVSVCGDAAEENAIRTFLSSQFEIPTDCILWEARS